MISKNYLSLKREFDVFILAPVFHVHLEAGTAFRAILIGNLDTVHYDDAPPAAVRRPVQSHQNRTT